MSKKLEFVCWDTPYPANYGGAIEEFYKIKYLAELGVEINLHCFLYGDRSQPQPELEKYCKEIFYYERKTDITGFSLKLPYIVKSRAVDELLNNLCKTNNTILFDGIHTTYFLNHEKLDGRFKIVRPQNIENEYYKQLGKEEHNLVKKAYFAAEAKLLNKYEKTKLTNAQAFLCVSKHDTIFFETYYEDAHNEYIPCFHENEIVNTQIGRGNYCVYHGNMQVNENINAAKFLINEVFNDIDTKLIIAGRGINNEILRLADGKKNVETISNPTPMAMEIILRNAHIHCLPTFQNTGLKLKLLNSLYNGRFCITNKTMLNGTDLDKYIQPLENPQDWKNKIAELIQKDFTTEDLKKREEILKDNFDVRVNAKKLYNLIQ